MSPSAGNAPARIRPDIHQAAADWLVRCNAGLSPNEDSRFHEWLSADARHAEALAEAKAAWATLTFPGKMGQADVALQKLAARERRRSRRRRRVGAAAVASLAAAAALVFAFLPANTHSDSSARTPTVAVRPNAQTLPDGSIVELNADAEIAVAFSAQQRGVRLVRGEAHFSVTKDPTQPFVVTAGDVDVRAVGTAFSVRFAPQEIGVLVTEGRVAVQHSAPIAAQSLTPPAPPVYVAAGDRVDVPTNLMPPTSAVHARRVSPAEMAAASAWRSRRIEFTRATLSEAITLFNRQNQLQISIADSSIGTLRISGIFWADDPEAFVRLLGSGFNLDAARSGDTIVLQRR